MKCIILLLSLLFYSSYSWTTDFSKKVEKYFQSIPEPISGVLLVARNNSVVLKKYFGYANYEFQIPNNFETKFPIASNTKSLTAVAIMQLHEKGLLSIYDSVNKYLPDINDTITIHHLLTHTSGIPNYYKQWDSIVRYNTLYDMIEEIKKWPLEYEPGSRYAYCNTGYLLLAALIEKVSGKSFATYLQDAIFSPLGMHNSGSLCNEAIIPQKASGYLYKKNLLCNAPSIHNPLTLLGNGDIYASIDDMYTWIKGLFSGKLLQNDSLQLLLTPHVAMENSATRFHSYGWFIDSCNKKQYVEYSGAIVGYLSKVIHCIDNNITIILLTNCENLDLFCTLSDELPKLVTSA